MNNIENSRFCLTFANIFFDSFQKVMNGLIHYGNHLFQSVMIETMPDNGFLLGPLLLVDKENALLV